MAFLFSIFFWTFIALSSLAFMPIAFLIWAATVLFDRRLVALHAFTSYWAALYTWLNPLWKVSVTGRERIDRKEAYVMVSNHQSLVDILTLFRIFAHFKWVSKIENFYVPLIGWNMSLNRYIKLKRGSMRSNVQMLQDCEDTLAQGSSVLIFPEGTRSGDGKVRTFKDGAFEVAQRARRPILPIAVYGSSKALPARGFTMRGNSDIRIHILPPIPFEDFDGEESDELAERVRQIILTELQSMTGTSHAAPEES